MRHMPTSLGTTLVDDDPGVGEQTRDEPSAFLFTVLECERPRAGGTRHQLSGLRSVAIGRASFRRATRAMGALELKIPDSRLSHRHARITLVRGQWVLEDDGSKNGTRVNDVSVQQKQLEDGDLIEVGRAFLLFRDGLRRCRRLDVDAEQETVLTLSPELEHDFDRLEKVAPARELAILIEGESGSGKEVLARQIQKWSGRSGAFVAVNCGALVENLVESQLFGSTKGAFSGATQDRTGFVRSADQGCLFLDEIAELPLASQATLLRVLEEHEVVPVGGTRPIPVDIKVLAATHQNLDARVASGRFRRDLFARISGFRVQLPSLGDRREDFGLLLQALLAKAEHVPAEPKFSSEAARAMLAYSWPLNVRELSHALGSALLLSDDGLVELRHLPQELHQRQGSKPPPPLSEEQAIQREELVLLLDRHKGNISAVARELGKARMQVQRWLKRYDLDAESYRA
jgi:sigma-54 dependent transcriptional regulator, acetoin dehydrogenase operon transcriptional activator AcoR